jgi:membrane fusion protein, adhesin transport system
MLFLKNLLNSLPKLSLFNLLISVFCAVLAWSMLFELDKSTNVSGVVEPKGNVISLQNRFDGKIKSVEVSAGDRVKKGDILFVLDPEQDAGGLKEKILEAKNLKTQKRRHIAQLNQNIEFKKVAGDDDGIYQQELSQLKLELGVFWNQIKTYESEKNLIKMEIDSAKITIKNLQDLSKLLDVKFDVIKQLYKKRYEGELAYLEAQQKATEALGNIAVAQQNIQRLVEKTLSLDKQIQQLMLNFDRDVSAQISDISQRLEFTLISIDTLSQRVQEYEVKSPVDGTISKVFFNNVGEVVAKASTLGELIPKGRPLIFAGKLNPGDILDVTKGQETLVTLSNMDTRTEPPILGRVSYVETNSRVEEGYGRYFQVEIEFVEPDQTKTIMPGVDGSASILMGKRSVLEYVLEPIFASFKGALSE